MRNKTLIICLIFILMLTVSAACSNNTPITDPPIVTDNTKYLINNGGFECGDLSGWTIVSGNAFTSNGVTKSTYDIAFNSAVNYNKDGEYLFGRYNEALTGSMRSNTFEIGGSGYITFKLGAAKNLGLTYISIVYASTGIELKRFGNSEFNTTNYLTDPDNYREANLNSYYADLRDLLGKNVYILLVDNSTANWGFITADSFVSYYEEIPKLDNYYQAKDIKPVFRNITEITNNLFNGDFATGTLLGWTVIGDSNSFKDSHINENYRLSNRPDETAVGVLRSSAFKVGGKDIISFRLGATKNPELTYLTIKKIGTNEEIIRTYSSRWKDADEENTHLYYVDLTAYEGQCLYIEVIDNSLGDWGLVTLEQIRTYYGELPNITDEIAVNINETVKTNYSYTEMRDYMDTVLSSITDETKRLTLEKTFYSTIDGVSNVKGNWASVLNYNNDGTTFCYTGDIHAMWLRDSSVQVLQYLQFMNMDEDVKLMVKGLLRKQFEFIRRDPYANAFNADGSVFERKYEIDSLCYPIWLSYEYYRITGDNSIFDIFYVMTVNKVIDTLTAEQNHSDSNYSITNSNDRNAGSNTVNTASKLIWSAYRPSDDVCYYKFSIPDNMFAVATLEKVNSIFTSLNLDSTVRERAIIMADELRTAIEIYGVYNHPTYGKIYAFEVNGMTNNANSSDGKLLMDAANIPSLIAAPWLGYCDSKDEIYLNTRAFALSKDNPYYYDGTYASGIGDPHDMVGSNNNPHVTVPVPWHMSIAMQALTSNDTLEIETCVNYMTNTTAGTYVIHEAFNANNPSDYSRDYFTWPCSLYAYTVLTKILGINLT